MKKYIYTLVLITILLPSINSFGQEFYGMAKVDSNLWVDATEITNNEYRQFTESVRDSIARNLLFKNGFAEYGKSTNNSDSTSKSFFINWDTPIKWSDSIQSEILDELYFSEEERFYTRKFIDPRNLKYNYLDNITHKEISVYPDTTCWKKLDSVIYLQQLKNMYFWHPAFDDYPVVGINFEQAKAFCHWRTKLYNRYNSSGNKDATHLKVSFKLPSLKQWNYIAQLGDLGGNYAGTITDPMGPNSKEEIKHIKKIGYLINTREARPFLADDSRQIQALGKALNSYGTIINRNKKNRIHGLSGNAAEITTDGKLVGGSWFHSIEKCLIGSYINHDINIASPWMGFRCVTSIEK
mgnify:FL=1